MLLFIHCLLLLTLFVGVSVKSLFCFAVLCVFLVLPRWGRERERERQTERDRELVALLLLFSECDVAVIVL